MSDINSLFTEAEVELMKSGEVVSKRLTSTETGGVVQSSGPNLIDCDSARPANSEWSCGAPRTGQTNAKVSQPVIRNSDGSAIPVQKVMAPNMEKHLADHEARLRKEAERQAVLEAEREELSSVVDPRKLHDTLMAMDRKLRKIERENRALKKKLLE